MDFTGAIDFYEGALRTGDNPGAEVGWVAGEGYQLANFIALCDAVDLDHGTSVLDVGCGTGALVEFLARTGRRVDYVGVDISANMIETARARHPGAVFEQRDILVDPPERRFDVVVCSGTLNYRIAEHARWVSEMITRMYSLADRAAVINVLNAAIILRLKTQLADKNEYARFVPEELVRFARQLCPDVRVTNTWGPTFELVLQRPPAGTLAALARALGITTKETPELHAVIEYAWRRRLYAELRDLLLTVEPSAAILEHLARAHTQLGEHPEAIRAFEKAAALAPTRADGCTSLGRLHFDAGRDAEAQTWFREALSRDRDTHDARYGLVLSLLRGRDVDGARAVAIDTPDGPLRELLDGRTSRVPAHALEAYERSLVRAPRFLDAIAAVATVYEQQARWSEAAALWERALEIAVDDPDVRQRLVRARANQTRIVGEGD